MNKITNTDLRNFDCAFVSSEWLVYNSDVREYETIFKNKVLIFEPNSFNGSKTTYNVYDYHYKSTETPIILDKKWIKANWVKIKKNSSLIGFNTSLYEIANHINHSIDFDLKKKSMMGETCIKVVVYLYNYHKDSKKTVVFTRKDGLKSLNSAPMKSTRKQQKDGKRMYGQYKGMVGDVKQMGKQFSKNFKKLI